LVDDVRFRWFVRVTFAHRRKLWFPCIIVQGASLYNSLFHIIQLFVFIDVDSINLPHTQQIFLWSAEPCLIFSIGQSFHRLIGFRCISTGTAGCSLLCGFTPGSCPMFWGRRCINITNESSEGINEMFGDVTEFTKLIRVRFFWYVRRYSMWESKNISALYAEELTMSHETT